MANDIANAHIRRDLADWMLSFTPRDLALPPEEMYVNQELITLAGKVEARRLSLMALALRRLEPNIYDRYYLGEFIGALENCSPLERGSLLRTYSIHDAIAYLDSEIAVNGSCSKSTANVAKPLRSIGNAYTLLELKRGESGVSLPLFFDESGHAHFPGHLRYLRGSQDLCRARVTGTLQDEEIKISANERLVGVIDLHDLLDKNIRLNNKGLHDYGVAILSVEEKRHITNTDVAIDNAEPILSEYLESDFATARAMLLRYTQSDVANKFSYVETKHPRVIAELEEAVQAIADVWPTAYAEFVQFIQVIVMFETRGASLASASWARLPGVTIMRHGIGDVLMRAAELLHETAHNRYYAMNLIMPLLEDDAEDYVNSPWRPDPRPVASVLVGLHAFNVVAEFYARAIKTGQSWVGDAETELRAELHRLREARDVVRISGKLTASGNRLVQGIEENIEALSAVK